MVILDTGHSRLSSNACDERRSSNVHLVSDTLLKMCFVPDDLLEFPGRPPTPPGTRFLSLIFLQASDESLLVLFWFLLSLVLADGVVIILPPYLKWRLFEHIGKPTLRATARDPKAAFQIPGAWVSGVKPSSLSSERPSATSTVPGNNGHDLTSTSTRSNSRSSSPWTRPRGSQTPSYMSTTPHTTSDSNASPQRRGEGMGIGDSSLPSSFSPFSAGGKIARFPYAPLSGSPSNNRFSGGSASSTAAQMADPSKKSAAADGGGGGGGGKGVGGGAPWLARGLKALVRGGRGGETGTQLPSLGAVMDAVDARGAQDEVTAAAGRSKMQGVMSSELPTHPQVRGVARVAAKRLSP